MAMHRRAWQQQPCIRLNLDGDILVEFRHPGEETENWLEYNQRYYRDSALFVDGVLRHQGGFQSEQDATALLSSMRPNTRRPGL